MKIIRIQNNVLNLFAPNNTCSENFDLSCISSDYRFYSDNQAKLNQKDCETNLDIVANIDWVLQTLNLDDYDNYKSDSDDINEITNPTKLSNELEKWAVNCNVPQNSLTSLLQMVRKVRKVDLDQLPNDAGTVFNTNRHIHTKAITSGKYRCNSLNYWLSLLLKNNMSFYTL